MREDNVEELGKVAYEAYGEARGWETVGGGWMPSWEQQSQELREAWNAAAQAVAAKLAG
jgi:hypothetical protein